MKKQISKKLRIGLAGTPSVAEEVFSEIIASGANVCVVYTKQDMPQGRGKKITPSPVKVLAEKHQIPIEQPKHFRSSESIDKLESYQLDLLIVVAYGIILPQKILDIPKYGCINVHYSLLPRWRGAAPVQHAILAGDKTTGVCIMQMDAGLDTGEIITKQEVVIKDEDNSSSLFYKLNAIASKLLIDTILKYDSGCEPQTSKQAIDGITYAHKFIKKDGEIDIQGSVVTAIRKVRAFNLWPVAYIILSNVIIKIFSAKVILSENKTDIGKVVIKNKKDVAITFKDGFLILGEVQIPGKKPQLAYNLHNRLLKNA